MNNKGTISEQTARNLFARDFILGFFAVFAFAAAAQALIPTLTIYLTKLGSNVREIGVLTGIAAVASLVSRLFVGGALLKFSEKSVIMAGALLSGITFLASIVFRPFWPFLIIRFLQGVALACIDTAAIASVINAIPLAMGNQRWFEWIEKETKGAVKIKPYWAGTLVSAKESIAEATSGVAYIVCISPIYEKAGIDTTRDKPAFTKARIVERHNSKYSGHSGTNSRNLEMNIET